MRGDDALPGEVSFTPNFAKTLNTMENFDSGVDGGEARVRPQLTPLPSENFAKTPATGVLLPPGDLNTVAWGTSPTRQSVDLPPTKGLERQGGASGGADGTHTGPSEASPPPTYAEVLAAMENSDAWMEGGEAPVRPQSTPAPRKSVDLPPASRVADDANAGPSEASSSPTYAEILNTTENSDAVVDGGEAPVRPQLTPLPSENFAKTPATGVPLPPGDLNTVVASDCPSSGWRKEILTTRLECDRGVMTLKSDLHALQVVVPNLEHAVNATMFADNSASSTVIEGRMHVILPIVTCGPAGLSFAQPLRLRFHLCGTEDASESSDADSTNSTDSTCSVGSDGRSSAYGDERLRCSHKVVMQKGSDTSSRDWTVLDGTLVPEGEDLFLEANISHFCRFGLAREVGRDEESDNGYTEVDLARRCKKKGTARFVNLSDHTATFYLQPKVFDTKRHKSGGFSLLDKLSGSFSQGVERTALATQTALFADMVQVGPNKCGDGRIGESVGSQVTVAVTTSQQETVGGWWQSVHVRKVSVWDIKTAKHKKALVLLNNRFLPADSKYPACGHFTVDVGGEAEANIARKVHDAITKKR